MPVYKILDEMPYDELQNWGLYFKQRPVEWRDDNRTYMLLSAQGVKQKPEQLFSSLASLKAAVASQAVDKRTSQTLVSSGLLNRLKQAASNNKIEWSLEDG